MTIWLRRLRHLRRRSGVCLWLVVARLVKGLSQLPTGKSLKRPTGSHEQKATKRR